MNVIRSVNEYSMKEASAVTVGTFDGVHVGHRAIFDVLLDHGRRNILRTVVVTFDPHPRTIVGRGPVQLLTTLGERLELMDQCGIDTVCVIQFTYEFSRLTPGDFFLSYIVNGFGAREMIIGHDHMFGRDREAGIDEVRRLSREYGVAATIVDPVRIGQQVISSSNIRAMLLRGEIEQTRQSLLRPYALSGVVVHGDGRGAALGFPTANLGIIDEYKIIPANGVYLVSIDVKGLDYFGMMNIGVRPTFENTTRRVLEVHIFNFSGILYDHPVNIRFLRRLREERKFSSKEELITQLEHDRAQSMNLVTELQSSTVN
jgi:riboflavin kinase/FMN adenylyltransferase